MTKQKMTVSEALAAGYEKCVRDGYSVAGDIKDVDPDELKESEYWILEKESKPYQISVRCVKQMIIDHVADQDEVADEDGQLCDLVDEIHESEFEAITKRVNEELEKMVWWPSTQILLIPDLLEADTE